MTDINLYKTLLETERDELVSELGGMAVKDEITGAYNTTINTSEAEPDELDLDNRNEDYEEDSALTDTLSGKLKEVEESLKRIEDGTYGKCEICEEEISEERLQANPSAKTCVNHMN